MSDALSSDLLLQCLKIEDPKIKAAELSRFSPSDWERVLVEARKQRLIPLLAGKLDALPEPVTPPENVRAALQNALRLSASRNLLLYHELSHVLETFNQAGIPTIVLKGAFLAEHIYENIGMRPMSDIDIMVREEDLQRAADCMISIGFSSKLYQRETAPTDSHELPEFFKPNGPVIDIHWSIASPNAPFKIERDEIWKRAPAVKFSNLEAMVLSPEDLILHLSMHVAYQHAFAMGLRPFCDITETLNHNLDTLDWRQIQARATQWAAAKSLFISLSLAQKLLSAPVEPTLLEVLHPTDLDPLYIPTLCDYVLSGPRSLSPNLSELVQDTGRQQKFLRFLRRTFPSKKVMAREYDLNENSLRVYYYYLVRLRSIISRNRGAAWRLLRQDPEIMSVARQQNTIYSIKEWMGTE